MGNTAQKKSWFLKRWICKGVDSLDTLLFGKHANDDDYVRSGATIYSSMLMVMCAVAVIAIMIIFMSGQSRDTATTWVISITGLICLANAAMHLKNTYPSFDSTKVKVFRSLFVLALTGIGMILGVWLGQIAIFIIVALLALSAFGIFGGNSKKKYKLDSGVTLEEETGLLGEKTYHGSDGYTYESNGDGTFTRI